MPWVTTAKGEIGEKEIAGEKKNNTQIMDYLHTTGSWWQNDETPWCSAFCNWTMKENDIVGTNSAKALSWDSWGNSLTKPAIGSIAVFSYGKGRGHVGYVIGKTSSGSLIILGGNQSNSVKYSVFSTSKIKSYVYPSGYIVAPFQYNLPVLNKNYGTANYKSTR
ncbi:MAG: TIGR02594 family protein [Marinifilum sp.]|jgi:uncharacterized protein (TIGR02594 family)|nr:TIGR02594 family protein [Marinifilum sp.]